MKKYLFTGVFSLFALLLFAQNENAFTYKVGDFEVALLSWGQKQGNSSILVGATEDILKECAPQGTFPNAINAFIVRTPTETILVDAGFENGLVANLHANNLHANQIDIILITHMHGDHIGGLLSDGKARFSKAKLYLPQQEYDYWMSDEAMNKLSKDKQDGFVAARQVVAAYKDRLHLFLPSQWGEKTTALLPGITPLAAFGHTPGHTMYLLESGEDKLLIWGDITHAMAVQMPYPEVSVTYDFDPKQAAASRKITLERVADIEIPVAGMHIPFPAIGNIKRGIDEKYQFIPF
jgi:Zn-dependent hydrolases, including glyoxylases